jgi:hypothetical protein
MINSTSPSDRTGGADAVSVNLPKPAVRLPQQDQQDSLSLSNATGLQTALAQQPEVRPEMVARGLALAADPDYPSADVISHVAGLILNSPDPSEDQS